MNQYKFKLEHNQTIVDSIVEGYHEYIEHRKDRKKTMKISSAFAWTKGNFIDSKVAENCTELGFSYNHSKAGPTWGYLQFTNDTSKIIFLIKNAVYFDENCFSQANSPINLTNKGPQRTYLNELAKLNDHICFQETKQLELLENSSNDQQLTFTLSENQIKDELDKIKENYNEFHILTYKTDSAFQISEIKHYLPNANNNIAYLIENLSHLISGAELTDEQRDVIAPEADETLIDSALFDIKIADEEGKSSK